MRYAIKAPSDVSTVNSMKYLQYPEIPSSATAE
jgi:hypothetical protein